jgi:hypothetical protein
MPENILILADWRLAGLVGDTVPPRNPNGDDDEEEEDEEEEEEEEDEDENEKRNPSRRYISGSEIMKGRYRRAAPASPMGQRTVINGGVVSSQECCPR